MVYLVLSAYNSAYCTLYSYFIVDKIIPEVSSNLGLPFDYTHKRDNPTEVCSEWTRRRDIEIANLLLYGEISPLHNGAHGTRYLTL